MNNLTSTQEADKTTSSGLTRGQLAAAIVVPIIIVILAAVGGYFLYRWLRSRRSDYGKYQPKAEEAHENPLKQSDPQSTIKPLREERLI